MFKYSLSILLLISSYTPTFALSDLDKIISPEIKNDVFYQTIYNLAKHESLETILEIGSSSGDGSTEAFVLGIIQNPHRPTLFCMEVSRTRFAALANRYKQLPCVKCYNVSSVPLDSFPSEHEVALFLITTPTNLSSHGHETVLRWLKQDIDYVRDAQVPENGIEIIKRENNIDHFDMVLIDGSEFTGIAEFKLVYGAKFILLDDISGFKNHTNYVTLCNDPSYELIEENKKLRNGYAVFKKKNQ